MNDSIFFSQNLFQKLFIKACYKFFIRQRREKQIAALNFSDHSTSDTISKDQILNKKFPTKKSKKSPTIALTVFWGRKFFVQNFIITHCVRRRMIWKVQCCNPFFSMWPSKKMYQFFSQKILKSILGKPIVELCTSVIAEIDADSNVGIRVYFCIGTRAWLNFLFPKFITKLIIKTCSNFFYKAT